MDAVKRAARALSALWRRWDVVLWSLDAESATGTLGAFPLELLAGWRARLWLARRAPGVRTVPIVMRREA